MYLQCYTYNIRRYKRRKNEYIGIAEQHRRNTTTCEWRLEFHFGFLFFLIVPPLKCTTGCLCGVCDARKLWRQSSGTENKITVFLNPFQNKLINTNAPRSLKLQIERSQRTYAELVCERILQNVC